MRGRRTTCPHVNGPWTRGGFPGRAGTGDGALGPKEVGVVGGPGKPRVHGNGAAWEPGARDPATSAPGVRRVRHLRPARDEGPPAME
ncbi:hypothetical protein GCM10025864_04080 [Luteimicrobium album]|uniref:Uncharacterized protein n=1 Tax=Luteimicrobium album TaxID=1054550 RepID=A0ABQ6HY82_9MICO|nr:hypothetical protein GCM10025864_04080 [Luteimicrobium album]